LRNKSLRNDEFNAVLNKNYIGFVVSTHSRAEPFGSGGPIA